MVSSACAGITVYPSSVRMFLPVLHFLLDFIRPTATAATRCCHICHPPVFETLSLSNTASCH
jgi:hypothetical protein